MLRIIFVLLIFAIGVCYAVQSALYTLLLYLWVAYFRPELWVWDDSITKLNLSYIVGSATVLATIVAGKRFRFDLRVGLLALILLQSTLSLVFAIDTAYAWPFWLEFAKAILITYLIVVHVTDVRTLRLVMLVIAMSLAFESAKQGWAQLVLNPGGQNINGLALFGDNNLVGVGMLMLVPFLTMLAATANTWWERRIHQFLALGVTYRAISTYSRGAFLASAALALYYILRSQRRAAALVGIAIAALLIGPVLPHEFWERMSTIKTATAAVVPDGEASAAQEEDAELDGSFASRLHFWTVAVEMANDRPFAGVGHNSYNVAYDRYDTSNGHFGRHRSVHSVWFGVLAELGYPGLLLFLATLVTSFGSCMRARRAAKLGGEYADLGKYAFAIEAALVAFIVGGSFVPFQYNEMLWHVIGLSIGLNMMAAAALAEAAARRTPVNTWAADVLGPTSSPAAWT